MRVAFVHPRRAYAQSKPGAEVRGPRSEVRGPRYARRVHAPSPRIHAEQTWVRGPFPVHSRSIPGPFPVRGPCRTRGGYAETTPRAAPGDPKWRGGYAETTPRAAPGDSKWRGGCAERTTKAMRARAPQMASGDAKHQSDATSHLPPPYADRSKLPESSTHSPPHAPPETLF